MLIKCPSCGTENSAQKQECSKCGHKFDLQQQDESNYWLRFILAVIVIFLFSAAGFIFLIV